MLLPSSALTCYEGDLEQEGVGEGVEEAAVHLPPRDVGQGAVGWAEHLHHHKT